MSHHSKCYDIIVMLALCSFIQRIKNVRKSSGQEVSANSAITARMNESVQWMRQLQHRYISPPPNILGCQMVLDFGKVILKKVLGKCKDNSHERVQSMTKGGMYKWSLLNFRDFWPPPSPCQNWSYFLIPPCIGDVISGLNPLPPSTLHSQIKSRKQYQFELRIFPGWDNKAVEQWMLV